MSVTPHSVIKTVTHRLVHLADREKWVTLDQLQRRERLAAREGPWSRSVDRAIVPPPPHEVGPLREWLREIARPLTLESYVACVHRLVIRWLDFLQRFPHHGSRRWLRPALAHWYAALTGPTDPALWRPLWQRLFRWPEVWNTTARVDILSLVHDHQEWQLAGRLVVQLMWPKRLNPSATRELARETLGWVLALLRRHPDRGLWLVPAFWCVTLLHQTSRQWPEWPTRRSTVRDWARALGDPRCPGAVALYAPFVQPALALVHVRAASLAGWLDEQVRRRVLSQ